MRDLTKSVMSYSWAMSVFGVQQMMNALRPAQAAKAFESVTEATEGELGNVLKATFRAGDSIQRGLVDLGFNAFTMAAPGASPAPGPSPNQTGSQGTGWGPVPPPPDK